MRRVYKYRLNMAGDGLFLLLAPDSKVVFVGQDVTRHYCAWIETDPDYPANARHAYQLYIIGTGDTVPEEARHVGSFKDSPFIWHIYGRGFNA